MVVSSVILQSADHTQTELKVTGGGNISPVLINPTLCGNVVLKVGHTHWSLFLTSSMKKWLTHIFDTELHNIV